ncbi:hypothetical protein PIB30_046017 [Stylosanthes scabra]|uniref:Uncharacterized protein n=1 Tax=Stylosanthes scabra TaxID=79078 RepID=A0ABU6WEE5_9FABA|nr:hypothetical protein [Stylosanthes scabra]
MGSGVICYDIEKRGKYEDSDEKTNSDLAAVKTRRYHFDDEPFIHLLHSVRFDPDHPYELPIKSFLALRRRNSSKGKDLSHQRSGPSRRSSPTPQSWELIPSSEGWMCEGDDVETKGVDDEPNERNEGATGLRKEVGETGR